MQWLDQIEVSEVDRMTLDMCKDEIAIAQKHILAFESKIAAISSKDLRTRLLMTIPGIGYVTALTVIAEVVDIDRFGSPEKLVSYAGIAPSQRSSGETTKLGRITKQGLQMAAKRDGGGGQLCHTARPAAGRCPQEDIAQARAAEGKGGGCQGDAGHLVVHADPYGAIPDAERRVDAEKV